MADKKEPKFMKKQIMKAAKYKDMTDLVGALLQDGQEYTLKQVDKMVEEYLKKEVQ